MLLIAALTAVYVIWGSTYLAIGVAVEGLPPFLAAALRFLPAGALLLLIARGRGAPWPTGRQWRNALPIGLLMLTFGNGLVCVGEQHVASGLTAVIISIVPALVVGLPWLAGGARPSTWTLVGLALGLAGMLAVGLRTGLGGGAPWWAVAAILGACVSWASAVLLMRRLDQPDHLLMRSALPMLTGGGLLLLIGLATGEAGRLTTGERLLPALAATGFLMVFGSLIAFTAYLWLQRHASPALATSNVYVNPVVALLLGTTLRGETLDAGLALGAGVVLVGVALILWDGRRVPAPHARPRASSPSSS